MTKLKFGPWVSAPKGKIETGSYLEHKGDTGLVRDGGKSKHILDFRAKAKHKALAKAKK